MKRINLLLFSAFVSLAVLAQDGGGTTNVDVNLPGESGSAFPWMWVVGGIVFVLLLVALLSGRRGGSDRVVEKKTIIKE